MSYSSMWPSGRRHDECAGGGTGLSRALGRFRLFHGFPAPRIVRKRQRLAMPRVLVDMGELRGLIYRASRGAPGGPRTYIHFMETPPQLACDPQGRQLYILGGRYRVTPRGIEG